MSKILVLDDRQFQEMKWIFESTIHNSYIPQDMEITSFYDSIRRAFWDAEKANQDVNSKQSEQKHSFVLEWHSVIEKPEIDKLILIRHESKDFDVYRVCPFLLKSFDRPHNDIKEWAYLPE